MAVQITTAMQNQIANLYISIMGRNPDQLALVTGAMFMQTQTVPQLL